MKNILLVPAYNPDNKLLQLINSLKQIDNLSILIINNGNDNTFDHIFNSIDKLPNIIVYKVLKNQGKGFGIKTGIEYILKNFNFIDNIIFSDADGQHTFEDIKKIHNECLKIDMKRKFLIGRRLYTINTPIKNYLGNYFYNVLLFYIKNINIDSLCGLRAISKDNSKLFLDVENNDFTVEIVSLLKLRKNNIIFKEIEISATYFADHKTNFHYFSDSIKLIKLLFKRI